MATAVIGVLASLVASVSRSEVSKKTAASLGLTQFITSWAVTISGLITYPHSMRDPHATLCVAIALLGHASHATPFWLGFHLTKGSSRLRLGLCFVHCSVLLFATSFRTDPQNDGSNDVYETLLIGLIAVNLYLDSVLLRFSLDRRKRGDEGSFPIALALIPLGLTTVYLILVILLKFKLRDCKMTTGDDNQWTFGQCLALLVLLAPIYSTLEDLAGM